jgi:predicted metal-binding transcription factor (methanogenesis marker protein 9)
MKAENLKFNIIDNYLGLLKNLSPDSKLELISKLSDSLKSSRKPADKSVGDLYGAFISKESADEIITNLKASRNFNRKIEEL